MLDTVRFKAKVHELYRHAYPYDDGRAATLADLAEAVGLSRSELGKRLSGTVGAKLTSANVRAIVMAFAEWGVISTRDEAAELLRLAGADRFTNVEWATPPLDLLTPEATRPARLTNLPAPLSPLIGRGSEVRQGRELLANNRLLTLTGMGGVGKTRLGVALASELIGDFSAGVWLVELASLRLASHVQSAVAGALGLREQSGEELITTLTQALQNSELLLVLDNCEHLLDAVAETICPLLAHCPNLRILATSRERLRVNGEACLSLSPLPLPPVKEKLTPTQLTTYPAVELFLIRAREVQPSLRLTQDDTAAVGRICQRLDGLPLALELAARHLRVMNFKQLDQHLDRRFALPGVAMRLAPPRQQTLWAMVDWSYQLLPKAQQQLFRALSVFASSFSLVAVAAIGAGEGESILGPLGDLVDKSLVTREDDAEEPRFRYLETIREFAKLRLEQTGDARAVMESYCAYYLQLAEQAAPELKGGQQAVWLKVLAAEHDNIRVALAWSSEEPETMVALRLCTALWQFWFVRGHFSEGRKWLENALAEAKEDTPPALHAAALHAAASMAMSQSDYTRAQLLYTRSLEIKRQLGDQLGMAATLNNLGIIADYHSDYQAAYNLYEQSLLLRRSLGDEWGVAGALNNLGIASNNLGQQDVAKRFHKESLVIRRWLGDQRGIADSLGNLGQLAIYAHDYATAQPLFEEGLTIARELGDQRTIASTLSMLGGVAVACGEYPAAYRLYQESLLIKTQLDNRRDLAITMLGLARLGLALGQFTQAAMLFGAAEMLREELRTTIDAPELAEYTNNLALTRTELGEASFLAAWQLGRSAVTTEVVEGALTALEPLVQPRPRDES